MPGAHRWTFKTRFREHAYGWRGSALASKRLKEAVREIKSVATSDRVLAAEGAVSLMERLWPALEHIDTSSGALGSAVHHTLEDLIPILISAPADRATRSAWLERLYQAVSDDGVQYLAPVEDRWGQIAVYPELMHEYADRLRPLIRRVWADEPPGGYVIGTAICLSCLLESGRYGELIELLACARMKAWHWHCFGAEALARQGTWDAAIAYAEGCREIQGYDNRAIDRFCEDILIKAGRSDAAYHRYGLRAGAGPTYLAIFRETIKRYPRQDRRQVLLDLIETRGERGKWFAAAKDAGLLDIALSCARDTAADPATLVRAARDCVDKEPKFAAEVAVVALTHLLAGGGYDPEISLMVNDFTYLIDAASRIGARDWAVARVASETPYHPVREYLDAISWDRVPRLDTWPIYYLGADDTPYNRAVGARWLLSAVARIYRPGCKADCMTILEGPQGLGKSTVIRILGDPWFTDELAEVGTKDAALALRGVWIIEFSELDSMTRAESKTIKSFMSRTTDRFRPPYGRMMLTVERQCVFAGSSNEHEYLKDPTGGRRFWPIKCTGIDKEALWHDKVQLWAEAVARFKAGGSSAKWWIDEPDLIAVVSEETAARYQHDAWEPVIAAWLALHAKTDTTAPELLTDALQITDRSKWSKADQMRISAIMKRLGWEKRRPTSGGNRDYRYFKLAGDANRSIGH